MHSRRLRFALLGVLTAFLGFIAVVVGQKLDIRLLVLAGFGACLIGIVGGWIVVLTGILHTVRARR